MTTLLPAARVATAVPPPAAPPAPAPRWVARGLFVALVVVWSVKIGVPADRVSMFFWLWFAAVMWRFGVPLRSHLDFARDWWPAFAILVFWTYSRGLADNLGAPIRITMPIEADRWLGLGELAHPAAPGRPVRTVVRRPLGGRLVRHRSSRRRT